LGKRKHIRRFVFAAEIFIKPLDGPLADELNSKIVVGNPKMGADSPANFLNSGLEDFVASRAGGDLSLMGIFQRGERLLKGLRLGLNEALKGVDLGRLLSGIYLD